MIRVALKGFRARKLRLALTALAVALGVALIAGTYVLTDTINRSFDKIFQQANSRTDVAVTPHETIKGDHGGSSSSPSIRESVLRRIQGVPGVQEAEGGLFSQVVILKTDGKRLGIAGPPNFVSSLRSRRFEAFSFPVGRKPANDREVALDRAAAKRAGLGVGDRIRVVGTGPAQTLRIVGLTEFGGSTFGGAVAAVTTLREAQRITGKAGRFDTIDVAGRPGVAPAELKRRIRAATPRSVEVRTGSEEADRQSREIRDNLSFLRIGLLAFAGIALFVGAFLIFNTFSITIAQRTRELALLRTLGAKRRQVLRSVLAESLVLGTGGALAGLGLGIALAPGLKALFRLFGADLPAAGTVIAARTVIVALVVGVLVTVLSSLAPALRATRVPPIAALREGAVLPRGRLARFTTPLAVFLTAAGAVALGVGLFGGLSTNGALSLIGAGAGAVFLGVALLTPRLVPPLASAVGAPLPGLTGRLARENAVRQPGRTAVTAAALMVGLALVAFASIFADSARSSIARAVDTALVSNVLIIENTDSYSAIPRGAGAAAVHLRGVREVSPVVFSRARVAGTRGTASVSAIDPATFPDVYKPRLKQGSLRALHDRGVVVAKKYADDRHLAVGDAVRLTTPTGHRVSLTVSGIADDRSGLLADLTVTDRLALTAFGEREVALVFVALRPGADAGRTQKTVERVLKTRFPVAEVLTAKQFKDRQAGGITQLLTLIYVLLALSLIVSLFGIVNTLALAIHERTRELGMLRAIGASRRQVRRMVRYEAVITSVIGAVLGIAVGCVLAVAVAQPLRDDGFTLSFPIGTLVVLVVLSGLAGVVMAIGPARRAARLDVLRALAYE
ncbi:MAG: FtsX-like permease family protein [Actinobacteria bacterium]|nr:MAG: FtsX-like permease family protein [Actinomycetota bacterium]